MPEHPGDRVAQRLRLAARPAAPWLHLGARPAHPPAHPVLAGLVGYGATGGVLAAITAGLWPVRESVGLLNIGLIFLIVVVGATVFVGRGAGVLAALLGFALFDYYLVPPYLTFAIGDLRNILALAVFLGLSTLLSGLIGGAREQAQQAQRRAADLARLYELSQAIIGARRLEEVLPAIAEKVRAVFDVPVAWIMLPGAQGRLGVLAQAPPAGRAPTRAELAAAEWAFEQGRAGGAGGATIAPEGGCATFLPLRAAGRVLGVLGVADKAAPGTFGAAEHLVLATFADQAAVALDRLTLVREAERAEVLARADELKSALMSAVSHDLRTPLASIIAAVTSLLEPGMHWDEDTRRDFLQGIYEEAQRLNRLVGNLLDMSRIEGGALHPEADWYNIEEVIDAVLGRLEPRLAAHPLTVGVALDLPLLRFDFSQIDQVLTNLVENALKYTPPDTAISVTAQQVGATVEVQVADHGPGVLPAQQARVFDKFYRASGSARPQGMGLGLAISKGLVEAHGGRIWAGNRPDGGFQVTFALPLPPSAPPAALRPERART